MKKEALHSSISKAHTLNAAIYSHEDDYIVARVCAARNENIMPVYCMNMPARLDMNAISCHLNAFHEARTRLNCLKKLIHHGSCQWPWVQRSHVDRPN